MDALASPKVRLPAESAWFPVKLFPPARKATLGESRVSETLPVNWPAGSDPEMFPAVIEYGAAVIAWRGDRLVKLPVLFPGRTAISRKRPAPGKLAPKSSVAVNRPLVTGRSPTKTLAPTALAPATAE